MANPFSERYREAKRWFEVFKGTRHEDAARQYLEAVARLVLVATIEKSTGPPPTP